MNMASTAPSRRETQTSSVKPRILIVEDETALVELLRYNLEQAGFSVAVAYDGEEALASVQEDTPDLILLDWMLPLMSGIEVCRQVRRQTATANVPIIMLTARGEEGDRVRGLDAGADDYVPKPFSPTELVARIRAVLRRIRPALADEVWRRTWRQTSMPDIRGSIQSSRMRSGVSSWTEASASSPS